MTASQTTNPSVSEKLQLQPINVEIQCLYVNKQSCKVPHGQSSVSSADATSRVE